MARYRVALLDVYPSEILREIEGQLPEQLEMVTVKSYDERERLGAASGADFFLVGWGPVPAGMIAAAPRLKLIQKWGPGVDKIDLRAAAERGIPVAITTRANHLPVADLAVLLMLAVYRRLPYADRSLRQGSWPKSEVYVVSFHMNDKVVGIVGLGNIGREVAKRVRGFGARAIYYDTIRPSAEMEQQLGAEFRPLDKLLAEADILTLHLPLTPETRKLVNERTLSLMKPTAIVVNTSRGGIIDEPALVDALRTGRIMGAGLDVFAVEPIEPGNPLLAMDNVVLTPHIGGAVIDNVPRVARHAFANMLKVARGEPLPEEDVVFG